MANTGRFFRCQQIKEETTMDIVAAVLALFPSGDGQEEGVLEQAVEALAGLPELDDDQATACGDAVWSYEDFRAEPEVWLVGKEADKAHPFWQRLSLPADQEPSEEEDPDESEDPVEEPDDLGENDPSPEARQGLDADALSQIDATTAGGGGGDFDVDALLSQSGGGGGTHRSREAKRRDPDGSSRKDSGGSKKKEPKEDPKEEPKEEPKKEPVSQRIGVEPIVLTGHHAQEAQELVLRELREELAQKSAAHGRGLEERKAKLAREEDERARKSDLHVLSLEERRAKLARDEEERVRKAADDELRCKEREAKSAREDEDRARRDAEQARKDELHALTVREREAKSAREDEDRARRDAEQARKDELHALTLEEKALKLAASKPPVEPPKEFHAPASVISILASPVYLAGVIEINALRKTISEERDPALRLQAIKALAQLRAKVLRATFNAKGPKRAANVHLLEMFKALERGDDVTYPNAFEGNFVTGHWIAD